MRGWDPPVRVYPNRIATGIGWLERHSIVIEPVGCSSMTSNHHSKKDNHASTHWFLRNPRSRYFCSRILFELRRFQGQNKVRSDPCREVCTKGLRRISVVVRDPRHVNPQWCCSGSCLWVIQDRRWDRRTPSAAQWRVGLDIRYNQQDHFCLRWGRILPIFVQASVPLH